MNPTHAQGEPNLWDWSAKGYLLTVTTNFGWSATGRNNMGAGSVLQAAMEHPSLPEWYGHWCRCHWMSMTAAGWSAGRIARSMPVLIRRDLGLVFLPVKPLLVADPERSWAQNADLGLIERGLVQLRTFIRRHGERVALTLPGAGNGGLAPAVVEQLVRRVLGGTGAMLVDRQLAGGAVAL